MPDPPQKPPLAELVALAPQFLANSTQAMVALSHSTRTVSIVFVSLPDAVGAGLVNNLVRPGGNITFPRVRFGMGAKVAAHRCSEGWPMASDPDGDALGRGGVDPDRRAGRR
jgi:hypothetical protein